MGPEELEWVDISDFSPGIYESLNRRDSTIKAAPGPDGAADPSGTYGCMSDGSGGLIGMPRAVRVLDLDASPEQTNRGGSAEVQTTAPAPTDPVIANTFLGDFDIIDSEEHFYGPDSSALASRTGDHISETHRPGVIIGAIWDAFGTDTSGGLIFHSSAQARSNPLYYKATVVKAFHAADGAAPSILVAGTPASYWATDGTATTWFDGAAIDSTQKRIGRSQIYSMRYMYNTDDWKYGAIGFGFQFVNNPDANVQITGHSGIENGRWLPVDAGYGHGHIGTNDQVGPFFVDTGSPNNFVNVRYYTVWGDSVPTVTVPHANRFVCASAPNLYASISTGSSTPNTPYKEDYAMSGFTTWDQEASIGTLNNLALHWTQDLRTLTAESGTGENNAPLVLPTTGYTQINGMVSVHASKLFCITTSRGAIIVEGDMNNTNVTSMPSVESTYGYTPHPISVNGGVVYGSKSGIFMWTGEDNSQHLSPQLHGRFWLTDSMDGEGTYQAAAPRGRMAYRWPYLYVPNGWVLNMETGGWWQWSEQAIGEAQATERYTHHRLDADGNIWAARDIHDSESAAAVNATTGLVESVADESESPTITNWPVVEIDPDTERTAWRWQSQPLSISRNRTVELRELAFTFQTEATDASATIIYVGSEDTVLFSWVLDEDDFNSGYPTTVNLYPNVTGQNLQIGIYATMDAPLKLHRISYGWRSAERIRQASGTKLI